MKIRLSLFCIWMLCGAAAFPQSEKFDIASFTPPAGWQRLDSNGVLILHNYKTSNGLTSFCQIVLFPSRASSKTPAKNFQDEWKERVVSTTGTKAKPATKSEITPGGWTMVTGAANIQAKGLEYGCVLTSISGYGRVMSVMINIAGQDFLPDAEHFMAKLELDSKASTMPAANPDNISRNFEWNNYQFIAPENWTVKNNKDHIQIQNPQSGCLIRILQPQPSSGNLQQDAQSVFDLMYTGWQYRNSGEKKFDLVKGLTPQGLPFCMIEAAMSQVNADGGSDWQDGAALVIQIGNKVSVISVRHNSLMMGHQDCENKYTTWRRFFNSFTIKNQPLENKTEDLSKRIVGKWKMSENGPAIGDYLFAVNGQYQLIGGLGTSSSWSDYHYVYTQITSVGFVGDGSYSLSGNQLLLKKRSVNAPELIRVRFDQVNHGGTGWKERMFLLSKDKYGENEVRYEKMVNNN